MFSRISRYRGLPDEATADARRGVVRWKSLRLAPPAPGTFLHTVEEGDRLDHLAFKYYEQPRDWWRIADANPGFLSPAALLGAEPRPTVRIPVEWQGPAAPWTALLGALRELRGVERAVAGTPERPVPGLSVIEREPLAELDPALAGALDQSVVAQAPAPAVRDALLAQGIELAPGVRVHRPQPGTWVLAEPPPGRVLTLRLAAGELVVFDSQVLHAWIVEATYDGVLLRAADLLARIDQAGFRAGAAEEVGRVGKPIVVPPRRG